MANKIDAFDEPLHNARESEMELNEVSAKIGNVASKVYNELGPFLSPSIYRSCMIMELKSMGVPVQAQVFVPVFYRGERVTPSSALRDYNASLEQESAPGHLNEAFIESKLCELESIESGCSEHGKAYWLTYARVFELALLCAGDYADHFEFAAAGDLLVNPRLILIHLKNGCKAVRKDRHRKLTEQFQYVAGKREEVVAWLKKETAPEIVEKPLLPHMQERMTQSGFLSEEYLDLAERRMERIADAIGFLASWHLTAESAFYLQVQGASSSEKSFIESNLCRFDKKIFFELGHDFRKRPVDPYHKSRFLRHPTLYRSDPQKNVTSRQSIPDSSHRGTFS